MTQPPTEQEIRLFVGKNANYYLQRWYSWLPGEGNGSSFNAAAFWLAGFWLAYRKMYKITLIFYGSIIAETVLENILFLGILNYKEIPTGWNFIVGIASGLICGVYGNRWYYSHTCDKIAEVRRLNLSEESLTQAFRKRGGTSWLTAVGFIMMFLIVGILVEGTVALLLGQG
jgi:hypothetical protein